MVIFPITKIAVADGVSYVVDEKRGLIKVLFAMRAFELIVIGHRGISFRRKFLGSSID